MKAPALGCLLLLSPIITVADGVWHAFTHVASLKSVIAQHSTVQDPDAMRFRRVQWQHYTSPDGVKATYWCGEVHAQTEQDDEASWQRFVVENKRGAISVFMAQGEFLGPSLFLIKTWCEGSLIVPEGEGTML